MPELPEAETVARALNRALKKRKIEKVEIFAPKLRTPLKPLCGEARGAGVHGLPSAGALCGCGPG